MKTALATLCLLLSAGAHAQPAQVDAERVRLIRQAAVSIWKLQREQGNNTAITESNDCRARLIKTKTSYDSEVEACLVIDYYVSMSMAAFYERLSEEYRTTNHIDTDKIRSDLGRRINSAYAFFKLSPTEAAQATRLLAEHVFPAVTEAASTN